MSSHEYGKQTAGLRLLFLTGDCIAPLQVFCSCSNKTVVLNLTHLSSSGAAGHASLPPLNQIRLSNMLLEYLIFFPLACQSDLEQRCFKDFLKSVLFCEILSTYLPYIVFFIIHIFYH